MKRIWSLAICSLLVWTILGILCPGNLQAAETGGLKYSISNGEVMITGLVDQQTESVVIPETIKGYPVTSIGTYAFLECMELTEITLPNTIKRIEEHAFEGCVSLENLTIPNSVTYIGSYAFLDCVSLKTVTNLADLSVIEPGTFNGCSSLTSVNIPTYVWTIRSGAFLGCIALEHISIPRYVVTIGEYAFYGCENLTSLDLPSDLNTIKKGAFLDTNVSTINYIGTKAEWNGISIEEENDRLFTAKVIYQKLTLTITQQPVDLTADPGESVKFSIAANGDGLQYQWYYALAGSDSFIKWSGRTQSSFSFAPTEAKSGMRVYCIVTDEYGKTAQSNTVTLTVRKKAAITQQPVDLETTASQPVKFTVKATGDGLQYQWYYAMPGDNSFTKWSGRTVSSFSFTPTESKDGLRAYCIVTDGYGNTVKSNTVTLTVHCALKILQQPVNADVVLGGKVNFSIKAQGSGLTYEWYYKLAGQKSFTLWEGRTSASFNYVPAANKNGMQVCCIVRDASGKFIKSDIATLTIRKELKILEQPVNREVYTSTPIVYRVKAEGDGLTYQWYYRLPGKEFALWSGRTSSEFTFVPSSTKDGMQVYCIVQDAYGKKLQTNTVTLTLLK